MPQVLLWYFVECKSRNVNDSDIPAPFPSCRTIHCWQPANTQRYFQLSSIPASHLICKLWICHSMKTRDPLTICMPPQMPLTTQTSFPTEYIWYNRHRHNMSCIDMTSKPTVMGMAVKLPKCNVFNKPLTNHLNKQKTETICYIFHTSMS